MADRLHSQRQAKKRRAETNSVASLQPDRPAVLSLVSPHSQAGRGDEQAPTASSAAAPAGSRESTNLPQFSYDFAQFQQQPEANAPGGLRQDRTGTLRRRPTRTAQAARPAAQP